MTELPEESDRQTADDAPTTYLKIASGWFLILGIMGLLLVGFGGSPREMFWMLVDPVSSVIHLAIGLVGTAMVVSPDRARRATALLAVGLIIWATVAALSGGSLGSWATDDIQVVLMHALLGVAAVVSLALGRGATVPSGPSLEGD